MPSLPNWLSGASASAPVPGSSLTTSAYVPRAKDPNAPDNRLQIATKCLYERRLPGGSYITAHIERLQSGYYDSPGIHEDCLKNVRFVAIRFVFHEASTDRRFKSARIKVSLNDQNLRPKSIALPPQLDHPDNHSPPPTLPREKPKFLRHAPHLLYGSISPETLDWNFNLAGSVGVSQAPVSASISPSGGVKSSYKVYKMMKIQGSIRTNSSWHGTNYDIEDGEIVWTLEENSLQKSGLPREFTFVMMLAKGDDTNDVRFEIDIEPEIATWFGHFPQWWVHILKYQPLFKEPLNLDQEVGQRFQPSAPSLGFNFAALMSTFDDFVSLPGTTYGAHDPFGAAYAPTAVSANNQPNQQQTPAPALTQSPTTVGDGDKESPSNTIHVRIHLDQQSRHGSSMTAGQSDTTKVQRAPPITSTPSPKPALKERTSTKSSPDASTKAARRVTINGLSNRNPPKHVTPRAKPLSTHYEEPQKTSEQTKPQSEDDDIDGDFEYSFPEPMSYSAKSVSQSVPSFSKHRQTKSSSTASSSMGIAPKVANITPRAGSSTSKTLLSTHSLRRTRSRSGLRSASLHSEPEDEEAIFAAMDMLSGSPPPPAPKPPASAPPAVTLPTDDMILATPRTRAALADLLEVEQAESARIERRNGNLNTKMNNLSLDVSTDKPHVPPYLTSRSHDRDKLRQKRYSMPVTSTGIGYPSNGATVNPNNHDSGTGSGNESSSNTRVSRSNSTTRNGVGVGGNGRSSLMIPVGSKREPGLSIGVATSTPHSSSYTSTSAVRSVSARRAAEFNGEAEAF